MDFITSQHEATSSKVYYMDLLDEYTDSDKTLTGVAEELTKEFGKKQDHTILTGDGNA